MKTGIIIQARMGSERLPGKILKTIGGRSLLEILLKRISSCGLPVIVATTNNEKDNVLTEKLANTGVAIFRGDEENVLNRYYECAVANKLDVIIRLTADNPFVEAELITKANKIFSKSGEEDLYLYTAGFPIGIGLEIFSFKNLKEANENSQDKKEREHVTPFIFNNDKVRTEEMRFRPDKEHYRLTVDTPQDFILAEKLILEHHAAELSAEEIIRVLDENPALGRINQSVVQKKWNE